MSQTRSTALISAITVGCMSVALSSCLRPIMFTGSDGDAGSVQSDARDDLAAPDATLIDATTVDVAATDATSIDVPGIDVPGIDVPVRDVVATVDRPVIDVLPPPDAGPCLGSRITRLALGNAGACIVRSNSSMWCWGAIPNPVTPIADRSYLPRRVLSTSLVTDVAISDQATCALTGLNEVLCWGPNTNGQAGSGDAGSYATANTLIDSGVTQIAASPVHVCANTGGSLACWGLGGAGRIRGAAGNYASAVSWSTIAGAATPLRQISHSATAQGFIDQSNNLFTWGANSNGQIGSGELSAVTDPMARSIPNVEQIAMGAVHSCLLTRGGQILCAGPNTRGAVAPGQPTTNSYPTFNTISSAFFSAVAVGGSATQLAFTCAISADQLQVQCWGSNASGAIGQPPSPGANGITTVMSRGDGFKLIGAASAYACAVSRDDRVFCWGDNATGQVAPATISPSDSSTIIPTPVEIPLPCM